MSGLPAVVIEVRPGEGCRFGAASKCGKPPSWTLGGVPLCQEHALRMCKIVPAAREKLTPWGWTGEGKDGR